MEHSKFVRYVSYAYAISVSALALFVISECVRSAKYNVGIALIQFARNVRLNVSVADCLLVKPASASRLYS
jgi:hypothetical protein